MLNDLIKREQDRFEEQLDEYSSNGEWYCRTEDVKDFLSSSIHQVVKEVLEEVQQMLDEHENSGCRGTCIDMLQDDFIKLESKINERE